MSIEMRVLRWSPEKNSGNSTLMGFGKQGPGCEVSRQRRWLESVERLVHSVCRLAWMGQVLVSLDSGCGLPGAGLKNVVRRPASVSECPSGTVRRSGKWYCGRQRSHSHGAGLLWAVFILLSSSHFSTKVLLLSSISRSENWVKISHCISLICDSFPVL